MGETETKSDLQRRLKAHLLCAERNPHKRDQHMASARYCASELGEPLPQAARPSSFGDSGIDLSGLSESDAKLVNEFLRQMAASRARSLNDFGPLPSDVAELVNGAMGAFTLRRATRTYRCIHCETRSIRPGDFYFTGTGSRICMQCAGKDL